MCVYQGVLQVSRTCSVTVKTKTKQKTKQNKKLIIEARNGQIRSRKEGVRGPVYVGVRGVCLVCLSTAEVQLTCLILFLDRFHIPWKRSSRQPCRFWRGEFPVRFWKRRLERKRDIILLIPYGAKKSHPFRPRPEVGDRFGKRDA